MSCRANVAYLEYEILILNLILLKATDVLPGLLLSVSPGHTVLVLQVSSGILYLDFTVASVKFTVLFYVTLYS